MKKTVDGNSEGKSTKGKKTVEGVLDGNSKMEQKPGREFWWKTQNGEKTWKEVWMGIGVR